MANVDGATFMQIQEKCDDCPDVHWLNYFYVFIPKIGPLVSLAISIESFVWSKCP